MSEKTLQPIYYPSVNKENLEIFEKKFINKFNEKSNHLALLSYDLIGLIYYLSYKNNTSDLKKLFKEKNSFKGKIGKPIRKKKWNSGVFGFWPHMVDFGEIFGAKYSHMLH